MCAVNALRQEQLAEVRSLMARGDLLRSRGFAQTEQRRLVGEFT